MAEMGHQCKSRGNSKSGSKSKSKGPTLTEKRG